MSYFFRFMELFPSYQPSLLSGPSPALHWRDLGLLGRKVCVETIIHHSSQLSLLSSARVPRCQEVEIETVDPRDLEHLLSGQSGSSTWLQQIRIRGISHLIHSRLSQPGPSRHLLQLDVVQHRLGGSQHHDPLQSPQDTEGKQVRWLVLSVPISQSSLGRTNNQALFRCIGKTNGSAQAMKNIKIRRLVRFSN